MSQIAGGSRLRCGDPGRRINGSGSRLGSLVLVVDVSIKLWSYILDIDSTYSLSKKFLPLLGFFLYFFQLFTHFHTGNSGKVETGKLFCCCIFFSTMVVVVVQYLVLPDEINKKNPCIWGNFPASWEISLRLITWQHCNWAVQSSINQ